MAETVLHIVDATTNGDALETLTHLLARTDKAFEQHVLLMGHHGTKALLSLAGADLPSLQNEGRLHHIRSLGWADPTGWLGARRIVKGLRPAVLQTYGLSATVAATLCEASSAAGSPFQRVAVITAPPPPPTLHRTKLLRHCESRGDWRFVVSSSTLLRQMATHGIETRRLLRIRPGIPLADSRGPGNAPGLIKRLLGIPSEDGPTVLLLGEGYHARHDYGLWAIAIAQKLFARIRVIVREPLRGHNRGLNRLLNVLPDNDMTIVAPKEMHWSELARAADLCLITPDGAVEINSVLHAFAAGVPVIGTPVECVGELVEHNLNGLISKEFKPRSITARVEEYMSDSTMKWRLTDHARAEVYEHFKVSRMVEEYTALWQGTPVPSETAAIPAHNHL